MKGPDGADSDGLQEHASRQCEAASSGSRVWSGVRRDWTPMLARSGSNTFWQTAPHAVLFYVEGRTQRFQNMFPTWS